MKSTILVELLELEAQHGVQVILAVESGSRGWGFSSEDSDYDVRLVYKYPKEMYLHLTRPQDNYEHILGKADYQAFDLYKFYGLLLKSNMNVIDWIFQESIYIDRMQNKEKLRAAILEGFNRQSYIEHNYGLCSANFHKYFVAPSENEPTPKRYVYCIRSILSAQYCAENDTIAPLDFYKLIEATLKEKEIEEVREIVEMKKKTREKTWYRNEKWSDWIRAKLEGEHPKRESRFTKMEYYEMLNPLLLEEVGRVWNDDGLARLFG